MADFYAKYSTASGSSVTVTANQGTTPWIVAGAGTAGVSGTAALTVQGIASGTPVPISGSITATNPSIGATGAAVPASGTYIAASVAGTLTGLVATANGLKVDVIASALPTGAATETTLAAASAKLPATLGQKAMAASMAVVVASDQSAIPVSGSVTVSGTVAATQSGTWNIGTVTTVSAVSAIAPVTTTTAAFQAEGAVAFGSITASYVTLFTPTAATKILQMRNNMNAAVSVSLDGGSTTNYILDAGDAVSLDLLANALNMGATAIQVKYAVGAPTSGSFRINACH